MSNVSTMDVNGCTLGVITNQTSNDDALFYSVETCCEFRVEFRGWWSGRYLDLHTMVTSREGIFATHYAEISIGNRSPYELFTDEITSTVSSLVENGR